MLLKNLESVDTHKVIEIVAHEINVSTSTLVKCLGFDFIYTLYCRKFPKRFAEKLKEEIVKIEAFNIIYDLLLKKSKEDVFNDLKKYTDISIPTIQKIIINFNISYVTATKIIAVKDKLNK